MSDLVKNLLLWLVIALVMMSVFSNFSPQPRSEVELSFTDFVKKVESHGIRDISFRQDDTILRGKTTGDERFYTRYPKAPDTTDTKFFENNGINVNVLAREHQSLLTQIFISWFPILLLIGIWVFFMRQMQMGGGGRGAMSFGRSRARMLGEDQVKETFADVAGCEEAIEEVKELVEFLRDPSRFTSLGGRIPKGVLMVGRPGTGKTLLARAIAGEARVPFFTISGSDFVEMFVGVGASRVRDLFEQAKKNAPCIIFIDEIDAVGRHRGSGLGGGHDEREQTLNQLLVEMDGFEGTEGVIVIAATNRSDVLDPALLRPGRFDRRVVVDLPDILGREKILNVHVRKVPLADDVNLMRIARGTPGFSGADLANLVNEAALFAARAGRKVVTMHEFEQAKDKMLLGVERRSMVISEADRKLTAYHEAGHTIVGVSLPGGDPVYKVTIIPRGEALGVTFYLPEKDHLGLSRRYLTSKIASMFGGRIAEELIFGYDSVTTGAASDIEGATQYARNMVTRWGFSDKLGPLAYGEKQGEVFLGHNMGNNGRDVSEDTARMIDDEVRRICDECYKVAEKVLRDNMDKLHKMAEALLKYETLDEPQVKEIMEGKEPSEPAGWAEFVAGKKIVGTDPRVGPSGTVSQNTII